MFGEELNILGAFDSVESAEEYINNCEKRVDLIFVDVVLPAIQKVKKLIKMNEDKGSNETLILKSK
eukprot:gene16003-33656_t